MFANKKLTYKSLIYLFCHDHLTLSELSNKTLLIDDINTFDEDEWQAMNKLIKLTSRHIFTYDQYFRAYDFINTKNHLQTYTDNYKPEVFGFRKIYAQVNQLL